jgi:hypothetical protein
MNTYTVAYYLQFYTVADYLQFHVIYMNRCKRPVCKLSVNSYRYGSVLMCRQIKEVEIIKLLFLIVCPFICLYVKIYITIVSWKL